MEKGEQKEQGKIRRNEVREARKRGEEKGRERRRQEKREKRRGSCKTREWRKKGEEEGKRVTVDKEKRIPERRG